MSRSLSLVSVGSCPTFQSENGHLGGMLMCGFVSINFCLDHCILGVRGVKASLQQSYFQIHQSLLEFKTTLCKMFMLKDYSDCHNIIM